jgi:MFS family permease
MPATGMVVIVAPLAGRIAGRIGSRVPMALGLALNAAAMALLTTIDAGTSYTHIWPPLMLAGIGMGLVMTTPMTAAVMSAVPRERAGMAAATSNASREIGGVCEALASGAVAAAVLMRGGRPQQVEAAVQAPAEALLKPPSAPA